MHQILENDFILLCFCNTIISKNHTVFFSFLLFVILTTEGKGFSPNL